jgi:Dehydratase family
MDGVVLLMGATNPLLPCSCEQLHAIRSGDTIALDVPNRSIHLEVDDATLASRRKGWAAPLRLRHGGDGGSFIVIMCFKQIREPIWISWWVVAIRKFPEIRTNRPH